uniref:Hexosyltransferase n=1 Tax=Amphilophus citrinellus TaxID=61819 RepID=A0A3Q0T8F7_AMPCI
MQYNEEKMSFTDLNTVLMYPDFFFFFLVDYCSSWFVTFLVKLNKPVTAQHRGCGLYLRGSDYLMLYRAASAELGGNPFNQPSQCEETNKELLQTNIHDFNSYPLLFQSFLQWMNCRSPAVLINQPDKCMFSEGGSKKPAFFLFAIKSTPGNFEQRQAVRETWGQERVFENGLGVRVLFLLGRSSPDDPDLSSLLSYEAKHFGDILQWDFQESFLNLTLKMNAFLHWAVKHCPHASFVFSGDDDVFVNTPVLVKYLQSLEADKTSNLYVGHAISQSSPLRDPKSKYYIPLSFYDGAYPSYAGGGGFLFSGALLKSLCSVFHIIPFFPIDDAYTGMCFKALGVSLEGHTGFQTFDIRAEDRENLCAYKELILVHQRSPQEIKKLWNGSHNPLLTC